IFGYFDEETRLRLTVHLSFSIPSTLLMPVMLYTGLSHRRSLHLTLAAIFGVLWTGTFVTGVFFLPHESPCGGVIDRDCFVRVRATRCHSLSGRGSGRVLRHHHGATGMDS